MATKKAATNSEILKQVIYEMLHLAYLIEILGKNKCLRGESSVESNDVIHSAVAVKFRLLYEFLYTKGSASDNGAHTDAYSAQTDFNMTVKKPTFAGLDPSGMFTGDSVCKYIVHLGSERITKPKDLPQPKFKGGYETYIRNSALILASAEKLIDDLVHGNFMNLNQESENCLKDFKKAVERLMGIPAFKTSYV